ncbi:hypothetical protein [Bartonella grahamii]|uniref:hypothetical protein n=1 Tax=Bartonella grahamii TaxID=33045 RepID=UPI002E7B8189|nr:hypothetical protein [Bartonella grahamii]
MQKKFALTNETRVFNNQTLYRIKALRDFADVKAGDLGGFIESENNLSHDGNCWVYDKACVYNNAHVSDNAKVLNEAYVFDNAKITGYTYICDKVSVFGNSYIDTKKLNGHINICDQTIKDAA